MFRSLLEIAAVVLFRFPLPLRVWALVVAIVNAASLFFLGTVEGRVVMVALIVAIAIMGSIYTARGFVRLLGLGHVTWIAMLPWLYFRLSRLEPNSLLFQWLVLLIAVNSICLIVDAVDVGRFISGDRQPHYSLRDQPSQAGDSKPS